MQYIVSYGKEVINAMPVIIIISLLIGCGLKRSKHSHGFYTDIFAAIYCLSLLYIWFFISAQGTIETALVPGKTWYQACRYGLINTDGMYAQFILNTVMLIPAGILCEVYGGKKSHWISLAIVFMVEIVQSMCSRAFDADDILAYSLGMTLGFLVFQIWTWNKHLVIKKICITLLSIVMLIVYIIPFALDRERSFGDICIEPPVFANMKINTNTILPGEMPVYRWCKVDADEMITELSEITGITGDIDIDNGAAIYQDSNTRLQIADDGTWLARWSYRTDFTNSYTEDEILDIVAMELNRYGYVTSSVSIIDSSDNMRYVVEVPISQSDDSRWTLGRVEVEIWNNGVITRIKSEVRTYERIATVELFSLDEAVNRYCSFPYKYLDECFEVFELDVVYEPNATGNEYMGEYLVPCLRLTGTLDGSYWEETIPVIDYGLW